MTEFEKEFKRLEKEIENKTQRIRKVREEEKKLSKEIEKSWEEKTKIVLEELNKKWGE